MLSIRYIGSKKKLLPFINEVLSQYINKNTIFGDLFAGTGCISYNVSKIYGCKVISNDIQYYSYVLQKASLCKYTEKDIKEIKEKINEYNNIEITEEGFFTKKYSPPNRMYFTKENALKIDNIRHKLEIDRVYITENTYYYLLASLISATDKVSNVSGQYGSYLKTFQKSSLKTLVLQKFQNNNITSDNKCYNHNITDMLDIKYDVVYLDPPYNSRQYGCYYHILETLSKYDNPTITGKTGIRDYTDTKSNFCSKRKALTEMENLISNIKSNIIIISYNDEGIINFEEFNKLVSKYGIVSVFKKDYKKFSSNKNVTRKKVYEYLFIINIHK